MTHAEGNLPPGPRFALLETLKLVKDPYGYYERLRARYGRLFTLNTLNVTAVMTASPEGAKEVLGADPSHFGAFAGQALEPILGSASVLTVVGEAHRRQRRMLMPHFHGARMRTYADTMRRLTLERTRTWQPGTQVRLHEVTQALSLDIILATVFGVEQGPKFTEARTLLEEVMGGFRPLVLFVTALQQPWFPAWRRLRSALERFGVLVKREVAQRRERGEPGEDILGMLLASRYEDGTPLSEEEIRDHLLTLLMAGHETTAIALSWAVYWLLRHPQALTRVREEVVGAGEGAELERLAYLSAVCNETLRLHPIAPDLVRNVVAPLRVQGVEVPAGYGVGIPVCLLHGDAELYPEPQAFRPERFLERRYGPFEFLPFGGGHRRCLGAAFAEYEMRVVLATLLPRFELELTSSEPERPVRRNVTIGPEHGVPLRVLSRLAEA